MKRLLLLLGIVFWFCSLFGQTRSLIEESRLRLISQLVFVYVDKPNLPSSDPSASQVLNNFEIATNRNLTGNFWTNSNNEYLQKLVKSLLQPAKNRHERKLQYQAASLLKIQDKNVVVYLFNDKNNTNLNRIDTSWINLDNLGDNNELNIESSNPWVFPYGVYAPENENSGCIGIGATFLSDYENGHEHAVATFLNRLSKTQNNARRTFESKKFTHGLHPVTNLVEIYSNFNAAYIRGIAYAFQLLLYSHININIVLNSNYIFYYEVIPISECDDLPQNCCIDLYLENNFSIFPDSTRNIDHYTIPFELKQYKIRRLPADVLIQSTLIQTYVYYTYAKYFSIAELSNNLHNIAPHTENSYGFPHLFEEMVKTGNQRSTLNNASNAKYFPLAILDYYTGFKLESEEVLNLCLRTKSTDDWTVDISDYWTDRYRGSILQLWEANSNQFNQQLLNRIAQLCDVRPSREN